MPRTKMPADSATRRSSRGSRQDHCSYRIDGWIGAGGMGEVYKATDTRLGRTAALKILPPDLAGDPAFRSRFRREAQTISQLEHSHICALYDIGEDDVTAYLVMPYLEGETRLSPISSSTCDRRHTARMVATVSQAEDRGDVRAPARPAPYTAGHCIEDSG